MSDDVLPMMCGCRCSADRGRSQLRSVGAFEPLLRLCAHSDPRVRCNTAGVLLNLTQSSTLCMFVRNLRRERVRCGRSSNIVFIALRCHTCRVHSAREFSIWTHLCHRCFVVLQPNENKINLLFLRGCYHNFVHCEWSTTTWYVWPNRPFVNCRQRIAQKRSQNAV